MSRSFYAKLHRRFGPKLTGAERYDRAHAKQTEFMGWLGLATAPSDCARFTPNGVAIVGGGFAGLAAAWTLGQAGVASTVFEARKTYGGRVESDRSLIPGRVVEAGAELIGLNHPMWLLLARRFGLGLSVITGEDQYAGAGLETPLNIGGKAAPDPEKLYEQMRFVFLRISNDAKAIIDPFAPWTSPGAAALDAKSVADKITEFVRLLPRPHPLLIKAIELQLVNDHVLPTKEQSYLGLLALVSGGKMGKRDVNLEGYWNDSEEFRCAEGNDTLAGMMLEYGKRVLFRPSSPVKKIEISETAPLVKVTWSDSTGGYKSKDFDYVILTAPPSVWKDISITPALPPGREMALGPAVKYISQVHDRFWIKAGKAPSGVSDELGQTWEATENQALASRGVALTVFAGGTFVPKTDAEKHFETQIPKLYPGYRMKTYRYVDWPNVEWIKTGYACPKVGQVTTIGELLSVPHRNRLYFAGEHTCMAYFGFMEGALQSGARAAKAILASCLKKSGMGVGRERFVHEYQMATERVATPSGLWNSASSNDKSVVGFGKSLVTSTDQAIASGEFRCSADLMRHLRSEARLIEASIATEVRDETPFSAADLFDAFTSNKLPGPRKYFNQFFEVVAAPRSRIEGDLHPGDLLVCRALGEGNLAHVALIVTGEALRAKELAAMGLRPDSWRPGLFVGVIDAGPFSHCREDKFVRRVGDENGLLSHGCLILRARYDAQNSIRSPFALLEEQEETGNVVDEDAAEPIFVGPVRIPTAPLPDLAALKTAIEWNKKMHPKESGISLAELQARLEKYIDRAALDDLARKANAGATTPPYGSDEATMVSLLAEQFQRKTCRKPSIGDIWKQPTMDGKVEEDTLDALGFVYHLGKKTTLNLADLKNTTADNTLKKVKAIEFKDLEPGLTAKTWWTYLVRPPWLGMPIKQGIHLVLLKRLRQAQKFLMGLLAYENLSPAELGKVLGLEEEHKGARPTAATKSMHTFGLGIDISITHNPWLSDPDNDTSKIAGITQRAAQLIGGKPGSQKGITPRLLHQIAVDNQDTTKIYKILSEWSSWLGSYFALANDPKRIESLLPALNAANTDLGLIKPGESVADAAKRRAGIIKSDFNDFAKAVDRGGNKEAVRNGFMDLPRDLVLALREYACLGWGAVDFGPGESGDIMHFDCRVDGIGRAIRIATGLDAPMEGHRCIPAEARVATPREFACDGFLPWLRHLPR